MFFFFCNGKESESTSVKYAFYTPKYVYLFQFAIEEKQRERNISNLKINYKQSFRILTTVLTNCRLDRNKWTDRENVTLDIRVK